LVRHPAAAAALHRAVLPEPAAAGCTSVKNVGAVASDNRSKLKQWHIGPGLHKCTAMHRHAGLHVSIHAGYKLTHTLDYTC
jgi:hypothetical protein